MSRRRYRSGSGGGGFAGLIGVLFIVGLIIKFIWWIIGAAALVGLFYLIRAILRANARQRATLAQRMSELAARADQQHNWVMQGDDRGIYGPQGADLMHYIEQPGAVTPLTQRRVSGPLGSRTWHAYQCWVTALGGVLLYVLVGGRRSTDVGLRPPPTAYR